MNYGEISCKKGTNADKRGESSTITLLFRSYDVYLLNNCGQTPEYFQASPANQQISSSFYDFYNMILQLPVSEAMSLIKQNSGQSISLRVVNEKTINVGYPIQVNLPVLGHVSKNVSLDVIVDKIADKDVFLHYATGVFCGDTLLGMVLTAIPILKKTTALEKQDGGGLVLHLNQINWVRDSLKQIEIKSLTFANDLINIGFSAKP